MNSLHLLTTFTNRQANEIKESGKDTCYIARWPEFHLWHPHGGRKEPIPKNCPLMAMNPSWNSHVWKHTHTHKHKTNTNTDKING